MILVSPERQFFGIYSQNVRHKVGRNVFSCLFSVFYRSVLYARLLQNSRSDIEILRWFTQIELRGFVPSNDVYFVNLTQNKGTSLQDRLYGCPTDLERICNKVCSIELLSYYMQKYLYNLYNFRPMNGSKFYWSANQKSLYLRACIHPKKVCKVFQSHAAIQSCSAVVWIHSLQQLPPASVIISEPE